MSRFDSSYDRVAGSVFDHKGDPANYTPQGGSSIPTRAIIYREVETVPGGFDSSVTETETHIALPATDVGSATTGDTIDVETKNGIESFTVVDYATFGNTHGKIRLVVK